MTFDAVTIERMVREVLRQTQASTGARGDIASGSNTLLQVPNAEVLGQGRVTATDATVSCPTLESQATVIAIHERVVTADILQESVKPGSKVVIEKYAILTPAAQDYLRNHRIAFERRDASSGGTDVANVAWKVLLSSVSDHAMRAIEAVCRQRNSVRKELVGNAAEAVGLAVNAISRAEVAGVVVVTAVPQVVACRANRHDLIRAAVITELNSWPTVEQQLRPNVVCLSPQGRGFMEIQNIVNKVVSGLVPELPGDWN